LISPVAAYKTDNSETLDTHDLIIKQATVVLRADRHIAVADEMDAYLSSIMQGSYDADHAGFLPSRDHFHNPETHEGKRMSAAQYAQEHFDEAERYYRSGNKMDAYYEFGFAIHVLQDLTVPHHSAVTYFNGHSSYESYVEDNKKEYIEWVRSGGIYQFMSRPGHYNDGTVWGWVDYNAHDSIRYYVYVDGPADEGDNDYHFAATFCVRAAVRTSAGFMKFFYDEVHVSGGVPAPGPGPILDPGFP